LVERPRRSRERACGLMARFLPGPPFARVLLTPVPSISTVAVIPGLAYVLACRRLLHVVQWTAVIVSFLLFKIVTGLTSSRWTPIQGSHACSLRVTTRTKLYFFLSFPARHVIDGSRVWSVLLIVALLGLNRSLCGPRFFRRAGRRCFRRLIGAIARHGSAIADRRRSAVSLVRLHGFFSR